MNYLIEKENFLSVDGVEYNSFEKAIEAIETSGTMKLIATTTYDSTAEIPSGKEIIFDLNGNKLTMVQSLNNNGTLIIKDSIGNGELTNNRTYTIQNNSQAYLTITGGIINNTGNNNTIFNNSNATLTIESGLIKNTTNYGVRSNGILKATGGRIETTSGLGMYINSGSLTLENIEINSQGVAVGISSASPVNISGGTYTSENSYCLQITGGSNVTISGGTFNGTTGIYLSGIAATITGGEFTGTQNGGYITYNMGTWSTTHSNVKITGGKFTGGTYGIYCNSVLQLGDNDGLLDNTKPVIKGETYGMYIASGTTKYYDGILKGQTGGYYGTITEIATSGNIVNDNEASYNINYLERQTDFVINTRTNKNYSDLNIAINESEGNDILALTRNVNIYVATEVPEGKIITIDLMGNSINLNNTITNAGILTLKDSSENKTIIRATTNKTLIINNGTITIENINFASNISSSSYILINNKNMNIENNTIISEHGYGINSSTTNSVLFINNSEINSYYYGISNKGKLTIENNTNINVDSYALYDNGSTNKNEIKNSTLDGNIYLSKNTDYEFTECDIMDGTISISESTILNISGGNISSYISNYGNTTLNGIILEKETYGTQTIINNTGTINIIDSLLHSYVPTNHSLSIKEISNSSSGVLNIDNKTQIIVEGTTVYGIYNDGSINSYSGTINVTSSSTGYGIYANSGAVNILAGTTNVSAKVAYGVYINSGEVTLGEAEDPSGSNYGKETANVSKINPLISAIGTTSGYGIKNIQGRLNYFDGKIIGSTSAKPEIATNVEYLYEAISLVDSETGHEYCVLEWMR